MNALLTTYGWVTFAPLRYHNLWYWLEDIWKEKIMQKNQSKASKYFCNSTRLLNIFTFDFAFMNIYIILISATNFVWNNLKINLIKKLVHFVSMCFVRCLWVYCLSFCCLYSNVNLKANKRLQKIYLLFFSCIRVSKGILKLQNSFVKEWRKLFLFLRLVFIKNDYFFWNGKLWKERISLILQ